MSDKKITEVGEDTMLGMSIKTLIALSVGLSIAVAGYYNLMAEIQLAKELPPPDVTRVEYELKDELIRNAIMETQKQVEQISADVKKIDERLYELTKK
jgi:hypothetical protein